MASKCILNVFALGVVALGIYGVSSVRAEHTAFVNPYTESVARTGRQITEGNRLAKECDAAWVKSWSSACKQLEKLQAQMEVESRRYDAVSSMLGAFNAAESVRSGVRESQTRLQNRNIASESRQQADYWRMAYNAALRRGDSAGAAKAQQQFTYFNQQAIEYGGR